jgi:hypothetical protein
MSDNNFKSNLPDDIILNKKYAPIRSEAEKEHNRQKSLEYFSDLENKEYWKQKYEETFEELRSDPEWYNDWYSKNSERLNDPEYLEKLSASITQFYIDNPDFAKERVNDPEWKKAHAEGCRRYVESADYVNPRGMLGKTHSEEWRTLMSDLMSARPKPLEGNKKVSEWRKNNWKPKQESIEKMRKTLTGRESGRSRKVQTPNGVFEKLKDAADFYGVTTGAVKNWLNKTTTTIAKKDVRDKLIAKGVVLDENGFPQGFEWLGDAKSELGAKRVITPDGIFDNTNKAAEYYKITPAAMRTRCKNEKNKDFKYEE